MLPCLLDNGKSSMPLSFVHCVPTLICASPHCCLFGDHANASYPSPYSSSLESSSSSSPAAGFFAGFFFFLDLLFAPEDLEIGCSKILRISSSTIFLSVFNLVLSISGGALSRVIPFLVTAQGTLATSQGPGGGHTDCREQP